MPIVFQKDSTSIRSNALVVGSGLTLSQTGDGLAQMTASAGGASGETVVEPSGGDDTSAIQSALWNNARVRLAPGTFNVSGIVDVPAQAILTGSGADKTTVAKANFNGPTFRLGDQTEYIVIENLRIVGPGKAVTGGNTGIMASRSGAGLPTSRRIVLRNLHIEELSDYGLHIEKCSVARIESCVIRNIGFNPIFLTGASTGERNSRAIFIANVRASGSATGIYVRFTDGVVIAACDVESCSGSYRLNGVNDAAVAGCVSRKCGGVPLLVNGGSNIVVDAFSSDNTGAASFVNQPHLKVDGGALGVQVNGFRRINTDQPGTLTSEADVSAAGGAVLVGYHDFTAGKILSSGKFATIDSTPLA